MPKFLSGKTAVVTGGTRGIGRAIAEKLADGGAAVALCGRSQKETNSAAKELSAASGERVLGHAADVSNPDQVSDFFAFVDQSFGGLDILVNNAGVGIFRSVADLTLDEWRTTLETNLNGVFFCCREAIPRLRNRGGGSIVNISSLAGRNAFAGGAAYNASKFALNGFSEAMMLDHRNDNVRVTYIMPGSVATDFRAGGEAAEWKIAPGDIADVVMMVVTMPARTMISRLEMRPSRPPK